MRYSINSLVLAIVLGTCGTVQAQMPNYKNVGRPPTEEEIRAWDTAVGTEGKELPPGSGTAKEGAKIYAQRCAECHGATGEGGHAGASNRSYPLVGGKGTLATIHPVRTIGSFWAFATTIWDYVNRAMPYNDPGSLTPDEVYAVTAFLLYRNDIIKESDVIDSKTLPKVQMPNRNGFAPARPEEYKYKPGPPRPFGQYP